MHARAPGRLSCASSPRPRSPSPPGIPHLGSSRRCDWRPPPQPPTAWHAIVCTCTSSLIMRYREIDAASESNGSPRGHYWTWRSKAVPVVEFVDTVKGIELVLLQLLQSRTGSVCSSVSITLFLGVAVGQRLMKNRSIDILELASLSRRVVMEQKNTVSVRAYELRSLSPWDGDQRWKRDMTGGLSQLEK
jgi:hypothetical protein